MAETRKPPSRGGGGGIKGALTRKIGPLPAWAWLGILAGVLLFIRSRTASAGTTTSTGSSSSTDTAGQDAIGEYQDGYQQGQADAGSGSSGTAGAGDTSGTGGGSGMDPTDLANAIAAGIAAGEAPAAGGGYTDAPMPYVGPKAIPVKTAKGKAAHTSTAGKGSTRAHQGSKRSAPASSKARSKARSAGLSAHSSAHGVKAANRQVKAAPAAKASAPRRVVKPAAPVRHRTR